MNNIYAIKSSDFFGHGDCLALVGAKNEEEALSTIKERTDITDTCAESNIYAQLLHLTVDGIGYLCIFADDINLI